METKSGELTEFVIGRESITQVYYGYDEFYKVFQTRVPGSAWAPVRLKTEEASGAEKIWYIITGFNYVSSANREFYDFLVNWLS